jgi:hypothetical protein
LLFDEHHSEPAPMMHLVHSFLKWLPVAIFGASVGIAGVWGEAKAWIAECAVWAWLQMSDPLVGSLVTLVVAVYVACVVWTGRLLKESAIEGNEQQPTFVMELPPGSASSAIVGNAIQGSAKITLGGEGHIFSDNSFGPDAKVPSKPSGSPIDERDRLLDKLMGEWLSDDENVAQLPFANPEVMYQRVGPFINRKLAERQLGWRVTEATIKGWKYSDR